ncbi:hypothetical protein, partial [Parvimonas sp. M13]|uniref:hypothetical protein n=1 Tax=Parvimonas sp. M13 TaxID=3110694 RepID=UPI002B45D0BD
MKKGEVLSADFLPKFTSQLAKVFNVDITKPVEGIVAAQNRLKNAMDQFYLSVDKSSGVTKIYQVVLEGFTVVMVTLTNNMQTVAQVVGALAGAFVGLGIAMMVPAAFALFGAMAGWIGTVISLARTITSLAEAVALFNAALMLTPAGWINLLVKIAAVAAGAAGGMWLMEQAQTALQGKMADTSGIE